MIIGRAGVSAVTLRGVAVECGWSTGILAHYVGNRQEMLLTALRRAVQILAARLEVDAEIKDSLERLAAILAEALPFDDPRVAFTRIFLFFYADALTNEVVRGEVAGYMADYRRHIKRALRQAQADGEIDPGLDPETTADALAAMVDGFSQHALLDDSVMRRWRARSPIRVLLDHLAPQRSSAASDAVAEIEETWFAAPDVAP